MYKPLETQFSVISLFSNHGNIKQCILEKLSKSLHGQSNFIGSMTRQSSGLLVCWLYQLLWLYLEMICMNQIKTSLAFQWYMVWEATKLEIVYIV